MAQSSRIAVLIEQLDAAAEMSRARLFWLTDDEYRWEPTDSCWSLRPRGEARGRHPLGTGAWQRDGDLDPPVPAPVTTIAWRLGHLTSAVAGRWEWTFGDRQTSPEDLLDYPPGADDAIALWQSWLGRWRDGLLTVTDEQADQVGFSQYPWGLDSQVAFAPLVAWVNLEVIHHLAEIALLRDLWPLQG